MPAAVAVAGRMGGAALGVLLLWRSVDIWRGGGSTRRPPGRAVPGAVACLARVACRIPALRRADHDQSTGQLIAVASPQSWVVAALGAGTDRSPRVDGAGALHRLAGLRLLCACAGGAVAVVLVAAAGGAALAPAPVAVVAAAAAPDLSLRAAARAAHRQALQDLPDALEVLAASCRAGVSLGRGAATVVATVSHPLRGVLIRALARERAGQPVAEALLAEAETAGLDELAAVARQLARHQALGRPLEPGLLARAAAARSRAHAEITARAGRRAPVAALVVAMVVAPSCVTILAAWVLTALVARGGTVI